uniref:Uncharacterized protein n=1 Tax=Romanomermis culicivorax TaxID=13658 RepID=A0A915HZ53_ROMCU
MASRSKSKFFSSSGDKRILNFWIVDAKIDFLTGQIFADATSFADAERHDVLSEVDIYLAIFVYENVGDVADVFRIEMMIFQMLIDQFVDRLAVLLQFFQFVFQEKFAKWEIVDETGELANKKITIDYCDFRKK